MAMLLIGIVAGVLFWLLRRVVLVLRFRRSEADSTKDRAASGMEDGAALRRVESSHIRLWVLLVVPACVSLIVVSFAGYYFFKYAPEAGAGHHLSAAHFPVFPAADYPLAGLYFLVMLAGMAAEYMFGLKSFKQFAIAEFVRPFWVSLIVFSVPWSLVDKNALTFGSILACYQNGFFWKKVLERRRGK